MEQTTALAGVQSTPSFRARFGQFYSRRRHAMEAVIILTPILIYYVIFYLAPVLANL